eukprot:CAMPEP_0198114228 /NCGR_PEP_ID=MMETSP1442-20131203/5675_1 /TAXON_ID= /ORGANISM="Craspedostauros australis, Strain CCMP3328" /LENGTH=489 /DNA_ID=CAMNT_0043771501 /DNA_START=95 /DNA_END=1564 /DNA_ORIENTATION=-
MAKSTTTTPPATKASASRIVNNKRVFAFTIGVIIALTNWNFSSLAVVSFQFLDDLERDAVDFPTKATGDDSHPYQWAHNITGFPVSMLRWPADPFEPDECNILDTSMPHVFITTHYPASYSLDETIVVQNGNLAEAWDQVGGITNEANPTNLPSTINGQTPHTRIETVACAVGGIEYHWHFPHLMQALVGCWSLWRRFPDAQHILSVDGGYRKHAASSVYSQGVLRLLRTHKVKIKRRKKHRLSENAAGVDSPLIIAYANMTLSSGFRVVNEDDLQHLRRSFLSVLGMDENKPRSCGMPSSSDGHTASLAGSTNNDDSERSDSSSTQQLRTPRIVIINRMGRRRLKGAHNVSMMLQDELHLPYRPPVVFLDNMTLQEQIEVFSNIDILLSPHGAQLTSILFMPRCSSVIEVFPFAYDWNEYFGTLAALSGVNHSYVYLGKDPYAETLPVKGTLKDEGIRSKLLCAPARPMIDAVKIQVDQWQRCCGFVG